MLENYSISDFMHVTEFKCVLVRATAYVRIPGSSKSIVRKNWSYRCMIWKSYGRPLPIFLLPSGDAHHLYCIPYWLYTVLDQATVWFSMHDPPDYRQDLWAQHADKPRTRADHCRVLILYYRSRGDLSRVHRCNRSWIYFHATARAARDARQRFTADASTRKQLARLKFLGRGAVIWVCCLSQKQSKINNQK